MSDFSVEPTKGLVGGATIQFAEGRGDDIGAGIAVDEEAFFLVEPCLCAAWDGWVSKAHYGVSELPASARTTLVECLRAEAVKMRGCSADGSEKAQFFERIADWLATRCDERQPVSILGV
jgi:hypothetical protein